jgi:hypothetical protein
MKTILHEYNNGNTHVTILNDGTKIRSYERTPNILFPETIDIKITNYCDMGCKYCHEQSTKEGIHGDLSLLLYQLKDLPPGVEIAIGGGNPLSHPDLLFFLEKIKKQGLIANLTVNQGHLKSYLRSISYYIEEDLIKGLGISVTNNNFTYIKSLLELSENIVYHLIAGVSKVSVVEDLITLSNCKILILGYKKFGFGIDYYNDSIRQNLVEWYKALSNLRGKCVISFDNLAIQQLKVERLFTIEGWEKFYMGDDFTFSMYIDAVEKKYAPTSRSLERKSFTEYSLLEFFSMRNNYERI